MKMRNKKVLFLFVTGILTLFIITCNSSTRQVARLSEKEIVLRLEPGPDNPRNSEGDFIKLKDGKVLFVYTHFTGGSGDNAGAYLAGRFSADSGRTWTSDDSLILPNEGKMNIMSVSLLRLQNGKIALFYLRKNSKTDCIPYLRQSADEAKTWSEPVRCIADSGYFVLNNDRAVQLENDRIILPVSLHGIPGQKKLGNLGIWCYYSDDEGRNWNKSGQVPNPQNVVLQEPGVVELKDHTLMLFCRTNAGSQYVSFSKNRGKSWSPVQASNITSPLSPASIERIPATGDLLLVWNNTFNPKAKNGGKRTPFNLAVSRDNGKTWEKIKTLENDPNGWYCYTAVEFLGNYVLLAHCAGNRKKFNGLETTQIVRLPLKAIYR